MVEPPMDLRVSVEGPEYQKVVHGVGQHGNGAWFTLTVAVPGWTGDIPYSMLTDVLFSRQRGSRHRLRKRPERMKKRWRRDMR